MKTLVCHGDSLTAPDELERGSIWPSLVESRLKINVINNGIGSISLSLKILNEMDEVWKKD